MSLGVWSSLYNGKLSVFPTVCTCSYSESEVTQRVSELRAKLVGDGYRSSEAAGTSTETHQYAEATQKKKEQKKAQVCILIRKFFECKIVSNTYMCSFTTICHVVSTVQCLLIYAIQIKWIAYFL